MVRWRPSAAPAAAPAAVPAAVPAAAGDLAAPPAAQVQPKKPRLVLARPAAASEATVDRAPTRTASPAVGAPAAAPDDAPAAADAEQETDEELDVYCVCRQPWGGGAMVCCDRCESWYHPGCIGMPLHVHHELVVAGDHAWFCHACTAAEEAEHEDEQAAGAQHQAGEGAHGEGGGTSKDGGGAAGGEVAVGAVVCTCERAFDGELVLQCSCCQHAYHPECVGLRQWEDWTDWRCTSCPRYSTRRAGSKASPASPNGAAEAAAPSPKAASHRPAPAPATYPWTVGCLVTMAFEEPDGQGGVAVCDWPGRVSAVDDGTGLLTIWFDDGSLECGVSPDDPDVNPRHTAAAAAAAAAAAPAAAAAAAAPAAPALASPPSGGGSSGRIRLRLGSASSATAAASPPTKRPRLVVGASAAPSATPRLRLVVPGGARKAAAIRTNGAALRAAATANAQPLRLKSTALEAADVGRIQQTRFSWKIGKKQQRRPLTLTLPPRSRGVPAAASGTAAGRARRPAHLTAGAGVPLSGDRARGRGGAGRARGRARSRGCGRGKASNSANPPAAAGGSEQPAVAAEPPVEEEAHFCPVCLCDAEDAIMTPCSHWFCRECLSRAAKECGRRCPMCRRSLLGFARALLPGAAG